MNGTEVIRKRVQNFNIQNTEFAKKEKREGITNGAIKKSSVVWKNANHCWKRPSFGFMQWLKRTIPRFSMKFYIGDRDSKTPIRGSYIICSLQNQNIGLLVKNDYNLKTATGEH
jgi:hypothetical protein